MNICQPDVVDHFYEQLIQRFLSWAQTQEPIRAVIQIGSRTRQHNPADVWADVDLMLYITTPEAYSHRTDWIEGLAPIWMMIPTHTAGNEPEELVMFENGYCVDFVFCPLAALEHVHQSTAFRRVARILLDRDGLMGQIPIIPSTPVLRQPPTSEQFFFVCHAFWHLCVYIARQIRRRDLWLVKIRDAQLKQMLLQMVEWHTGAVSQWQRDTWHNGRFIDQWADQRVMAEIQQVFGEYEATSAQKALIASLTLFRWLAQETATKLGFEYPQQTQERTLKLIYEALSAT